MAFKNVSRRADGSYSIDQDGLPYHVPNEGEWAYLWEQVDIWAKEHPDAVIDEPAPEPCPPTLEDLLRRFMTAIQARLDTFAQSRTYDGIISAASYATSNNPTFRAEGQYCVDARDATWEWCNAYLNEVLSGQRPLPEWADFEAELDAAVPLVWPVPDTRVTVG